VDLTKFLGGRNCGGCNNRTRTQEKL